MADKTSKLEKAIKTIKLMGDDDVIRSLLKLYFKTSGILNKKFRKIRKEAKGGIVKKNKGGLMVKPKAAKRGY